MKNISIWSDLKQKNICPKLSNDIETDVLIIGGGITGLSTAYHLMNKNATKFRYYPEKDGKIYD